MADEAIKEILAKAKAKKEAGDRARENARAVMAGGSPAKEPSRAYQEREMGAYGITHDDGAPDPFFAGVEEALRRYEQELKSRGIDREQLRKGIIVETEHTTDPIAAAKIAMDHLREMKDYYVRLGRMEAGECAAPEPSPSPVEGDAAGRIAERAALSEAFMASMEEMDANRQSAVMEAYQGFADRVAWLVADAGPAGMSQKVHNEVMASLLEQMPAAMGMALDLARWMPGGEREPKTRKGIKRPRMLDKLHL